MKKIIFPLIGLLALGLAYFFIYTPLGVHYIFGAFGNSTMQYEAQDYPTEITQTTALTQTVQMPETIHQASGIDFSPEENAFFVVTDQAEIMELSQDLQTIKSSAIILNRPLLFRQGRVESTDFYQDKLYISGALSGIEVWGKVDQKWQRKEIIQYPDQLGEMEAEAMAIDPKSGSIYLAGEGDTIKVINQKGKYVSEITLQIPPKVGRSISEYLIGGMDFYDGILYAVTEYHSAILAIDPSSGVVNSVSALEGITLGSGLTVTKENFFIVVDHELDEVLPGVKIYPRL